MWNINGQNQKGPFPTKYVATICQYKQLQEHLSENLETDFDTYTGEATCCIDDDVMKILKKQRDHFQSLTHLSWLAEATKPVTFDAAKADTSLSCAFRVIVLFSVMFQISKVWKSK